MKGLPILILLTLAITSCAEKEQWTSLFDGKTLVGWTATSEANWRVEDNAIVVDGGPKGFLLHKGTYTNYELVVEFKAARGTNSGVFLNTKRNPEKPTEDCYELNIAPQDNPFPTGSLVAREKVEGAGESDHWRRFEIRVDRGRVIVKLDGEQILDYRSDPPSSGNLIGLQMNSGKVAFRNIRLRGLP